MSDPRQVEREAAKEAEIERLRAWLYLIAHWPDDPRPLASDALRGDAVPEVEACRALEGK